jgi:hypothetical protein
MEKEKQSIGLCIRCHLPNPTTEDCSCCTHVPLYTKE